MKSYIVARAFLAPGKGVTLAYLCSDASETLERDRAARFADRDVAEGIALVRREGHAVLEVRS